MDIKVATENLLIIKEVFDRNDLRFWLFFGTFLGIYRDGGLIEYDNDIDLALLSEDWGLYEKCEKELKESEFKHIPTHGDAKALKRNEVGIDFLFFKKMGDRREHIYVKQITAEAFERYNSLWWKGRLWRIFSEPEKWLRYLYGDDWRKPIPNKHCMQIYGTV